MDGDGDLDVLSASQDDDTIAWYENTDSQGSFSEQRVITTDANGAASVHAVDLDGDGDLDVLSASSYRYDSKVAWYENTDGRGTFSEQRVISSSAEGADSVSAADLDGDGDMDVLSADFFKVAWHENLSDPPLPKLGDANGDGRFDSSDLITVFQAGEYEDGVPRNSTFAEGDWNGDREFDTRDLVAAFQAGTYVNGALPAVDPLAAAVDWLFGKETPSRHKSKAWLA